MGLEAVEPVFLLLNAVGDGEVFFPVVPGLPATVLLPGALFCSWDASPFSKRRALLFPIWLKRSSRPREVRPCGRGTSMKPRRSTTKKSGNSRHSIESQAGV